MKRSNRTMQAHIPTPKLRIKVKKLYDNNVEETFTTDNILEYSKIEDVGPPSGELAASYVSLNEVSVYVFSISILLKTIHKLLLKACQFNYYAIFCYKMYSSKYLIMKILIITNSHISVGHYLIM